MMFEYSLNNQKVALLIRDSVNSVLSDGYRTQDIALSSDHIDTSAMGNAIIQEIKNNV